MKKLSAQKFKFIFHNRKKYKHLINFQYKNQIINIPNQKQRNVSNI